MKVLATLLSVFIFFGVSAQSVDSLVTDTVVVETSNNKKKSFNIAARKSAILPGWGQMHNQQYWKAPIAFGGFSFLTVNAIRLQGKYRSLAKATPTFPLSVNGVTYNYQAHLTSDISGFKSRRNRNIAGAFGIYSFNIIDAYVSAKIKLENRAHSPAKAGYYAAFAPGFGQFYNGKYWKMPIVYAGLGVATYFIISNNNEYNKFRTLLINSRATGETVFIDGQEYTDGNLLELRNFYRRNLDLSYIAFTAVYFLQIVDAVVDAHLEEFNREDDMFSVQPYLHTSPVSFESYPGVILTFRL